MYVYITRPDGLLYKLASKIGTGLYGSEEHTPNVFSIGILLGQAITNTKREEIFFFCIFGGGGRGGSFSLYIE